MYRKEYQILTSLITSILVFGVYALYVYQRHITGDPGIINDLKFWGKTIIIFIPVAMVAQIVIHIIFAIINKIITREDIPMNADEMDRMIELKALRLSHWIFGIGFILAMGSQALGMQPWVMFVTLMGSCFLGAVLEEVLKIYFYRRGV